MFEKIALIVFSIMLVPSLWAYRRALARNQTDADLIGSVFFSTIGWFLICLGRFAESTPLLVVLGFAALASIGQSFRLTRRQGKAQKALVEEEYQRFLEKRRNHFASRTQR